LDDLSVRLLAQKKVDQLVERLELMDVMLADVMVVQLAASLVVSKVDQSAGPLEHRLAGRRAQVLASWSPSEQTSDAMKEMMTVRSLESL
jgi:hypothetical protein